MMIKNRWMRHAGVLLALGALAQIGAGCGSTVMVQDGSGGSSSTGNGTGGQVGTSTSIATVGGGGAGGPFTDCNTSSECDIVANTCCGVCGMPELEDMTSINAKYRDEFIFSVCGDPIPPCPACTMQPNPNLYAYCDSLGVGVGNCVAADVRDSTIAECKVDSDCRLRFGLECCESCFGAPDELVAISYKQEAQLKKQVCDPDYIGCPNCAPEYPDGMAATCSKGLCIIDKVVEGS